MIPFLVLLLLLLPGSLADVKVSVQTRRRQISTTFANVHVRDYADGRVRCQWDNSPCVFLCKGNFTLQFSNSSAFLEFTSQGNNETYMAYSQGTNGSCISYRCEVNSILSLFDEFKKDSDLWNMHFLSYTRDSCEDLFNTNHEIMKSFINAERHIIHDIMRSSQLQSEGHVTFDLSRLSLDVVNTSETDSNATGISSGIHFKAPQLLPQNESFLPYIWFPESALDSIPQQERILGLVSYMHHRQFQFEQEEIKSMVIRIELLGEKKLHGLINPIQITFTTFPRTVDNNSWLQCHYFDESGWQWRTDGCETHNTTSDDNITCSCSHTTPFAVLLVRQEVSAAQWKILSYISYIGCCISALCCAFSIVIYIYGRNSRKDSSISIHVSLSAALLILNGSFLTTEWAATLDSDWVCMFIAALMHYSLLCCFTWMAVEALHLYLLLIKVFNTYYKHYLLKLSLAGWGIPGVIVGITLALKDYKQFYGMTQMTMSDTNSTNAICWITDTSYFYALNLVYFTTVFLFNSSILIAVSSGICKMKQALDSKHGVSSTGQRCREWCRSGLTVVGLTVLMGTTWGLAFLGSGYVNYPILYLFCILNSLQGFFVFLWICMSAKKQRKRDQEDRSTLTPAKTSSTKCD
ncbi:uncharacterized protein V6R79_004564 [Siganus canaliculatus]